MYNYIYILYVCNRYNYAVDAYVFVHIINYYAHVMHLTMLMYRGRMHEAPITYRRDRA